MTLRRFDPLADLLSLQERMNRLFEDSLAAGGSEPRGLAASGFSPTADAYETADGFVLQVELPGIQPDDVDLQVDGDQVLLRGERRPTVTGRPERFHRMERPYGHFSRAFRLPQDVDPEGVQARIDDGLLTITLPKARGAKPRGRRE
ncbi:MAG TPA: Hsp20/alpha crystallin family protein [Vicinamibacteria bacterium]|nr:Hsp20/alpha crystallin family protein [Vicinamibacteria bacterium]